MSEVLVSAAVVSTNGECGSGECSGDGLCSPPRSPVRDPPSDSASAPAAVSASASDFAASASRPADEEGSSVEFKATIFGCGCFVLTVVAASLPALASSAFNSDSRKLASSVFSSRSVLLACEQLISVDEGRWLRTKTKSGMTVKRSTRKYDR